MRNNLIVKVFSLALAAAVTLNSTAFAQDANLTRLVEQLQQQMSQMQQTINSQNSKIAALEGRGTAVPLTAPSDPQKEEDKFKKALEKQLGKDYGTFKDLKFTGDLRLRYEGFQYRSGARPTAGSNTVESDSRNRFRYRLRVGLEKKFSDEISAGFALASGDNYTVSGTAAGNADPTSTNTTLDNNFSFKNIFVERAWATYKPMWAVKGPISSTEITAGKFKNPFERGSSDIIWDRDVRPEGIYESFDFRALDTENVKMTGWATLGQFILEEDSTLSNPTTGGDAELYAYQFGLNPKFKVPGLEKPLGLTSALSYYNYSDYAQDSNFSIFGSSLARGNNNVDGDATRLDATDFNIIEIYNELRIPVGNIPFRPFFDYATNPAEESSIMGGGNDAYALGLIIGDAKTKGQWELSYAYKNIEPDAVVGAFSDSDFGDGHANKRGSVIKGKYMLTDFLELGIAGIWANNVYQRNTASAATTIPDMEQRRFQVDLVWKW